MGEAAKGYGWCLCDLNLCGLICFALILYEHMMRFDLIWAGLIPSCCMHVHMDVCKCMFICGAGDVLIASVDVDWMCPGRWLVAAAV